MKAFLFDIDGTLIKGKGAGRLAFSRALKECFEVDDDLGGISFAGATDLSIMTEVMERNGKSEVPPDHPELEAFLISYENNLRETLKEMPVENCPGVEVLLDTLASEANFHLGLLTGNFQVGARLKLENGGTWKYFKFGGYADTHPVRNEIAKAAASATRDHIGSEPDEIFVIGDTPRDIEAAHAINAVSVAVATGRFGREELESHNPDHIFENFSETEAVLHYFQNY